MIKTLVTLACAASLALSGCMTASITPDQAHQLITDFHNAGCGGRFDLTAGAGTGQLGGQANFALGLHGECPVGDAPVPLKDIDQILTPGALAPMPRSASTAAASVPPRPPSR